MPLYTNVAITRPTPLSLEDWQPTTGEVLSSAWDAAIASNPMQSMENLLLGREDFSGMSDQDVVDYAAEERANPRRGMALDAQQARIREAGLDGLVTPDARYSEDALETIITAKQAENANALVAEKATGLQTAASFGAGLAASFLDPINIASAFVPVVGEARMLALLGKAGSFWGRTTLRAAEGAAGGAVGAVMVEPLIYAGQQAIQADYGMMDSLLNVGFGAAMGAAMQPVAGGVGEFLRNRRGVRHPWEVVEKTDTSESLRLDFAARQEQAFLEANPGADRKQVRENALAAAALFDARARAREYDTGMKVEDFYRRYGPEFRSSRHEGSAAPVVTLQQAAMRRSDATTIADFILQSRTLGNDEKTFFHFQTPLKLDGKTLPVELGSDQVRHIERRHPEFSEWEKIPEIIEKGEALYLGESRYTGAAAYAYILNDGGMAQVVIGSPLKGNAKRKRPGRFVTLTAFRDNGAAVSQWAARYGNAASPSGEPRTPPGARGSRASLPSEKASLGPQGDTTSPRITAINAELKEIGIGRKGSSRLSQTAGQKGTAPGGVRSQVDFDADGKAVITFFSSADASSAPHELYHIFRRDLADAAATPDATPRAREMWAKVEEFVGARPGETWTRQMEEKFARAGERFLLEGKAPTAALRDVFARLRQWFLELYADADAAGLEISDGMRKVFNDMLSVPVDKADMQFRYAVGDLATRQWEREFVDPGTPTLDAAQEKMRTQTDMEAMQSLEEDARAGMENAAERAATANPDASLPGMEQTMADLAEADAEIVRARERGWARQEELAAIAQKRAIELQAEKRLNNVAYVLNTFRGMEAEGLSALQVGSKYAREGARLSVDAIRSGLEGQYLGGFLTDLEALSKAHVALFRKGELDRDVARAMWTIDNPAADPYTGPGEAMDIARVIHKWQEKTRLDQNQAGAWIGKEPGYIVRQSHDAAKLRKLGFDKWKESISDKLDWTRTADGRFDPGVNPDEAEKFLKAVYRDIVTGVHLRTGDDASPLAKTSTIGSAAARASRERVLRFKSGDAWFDYNEQFGFGNLRDALLRGMTKAAQNTALMRVFGPSPQANLEYMIQDVMHALTLRGDHQGVERVTNMQKRLHNQMKEIDGTLNIEGNPTIAAIGRNIRTMESLAKLGGALISSMTDAPNFAEEFSYQGRGFFSALAEGISLMLKGRGSLTQRRILSQCGVFFDSMSGDLAARFSGEELPGKLTALQNLFFKMNGLSWWTDSWKKAATLMMSHDLAQIRGQSWQKLSHARQRALGLYGIDAGKWDMLRRGKTIAADGRDYLTPEAALDVPDGAIEAYLRERGDLVSPARVTQFRDELAEQLRSYFRDRVQYAVLEPDARTRAITRQGLASGTWPGEVLRFVMQFKRFPIAFGQRILNREIYGRGADTFGSGLLHNFIRNQHGEVSKLTRLMLMMTLFGYGSMTAKQLIAGKTPRDPGNYKTWLAAAAQGGGLGIYGDFLFGEKSRMGSSFYSSLGGPAFGSAESLYNLYQNIREGRDVRTEAFRTFFNHLPGNNLFWFRSAFDHFIGYNLYEMLNPGYISRMKRRVAKENGQTFWSEPVRW